ncbi:MAG: hypothetical protein LBI36_01795 [Oscillospiraceae bacterium]|jgi:hypothetical protein|nr:hypothetical protein [Oscillospiraceae bacterium]
MKKSLTILLSLAFVFALAACDGNGGGGGTTAPGTTAPGTTAPTDAPTSAPPESNDDPGTGSSVVSDAAFEFVVFQFNNREFSIRADGRMMLGDNMDSKVNTAKDAVRQAFQQEDDFNSESPYLEHEFLVFQNGEFWSNIDRIEAGFYLEFIECVSDDLIEAEEAAIDVGFIQEYIQLGGAVDWYFTSDEVNLVKQYEEEGWGFGPDYVMTFAWPINEVWSENGTLGKGDLGENDDKGGGVLKFGLQIGNDGIEELKLKIVWTDVEVFVYDLDVFNDYVEQVTAINGVALPSGAKVSKA